MVIISPIFRKCSAEIIVSDEVNHVKRWCTSNGLLINESKTNVMIVQKRRKAITNLAMDIMPQIKVLGVTFQDDLKWDKHIDTIVKVASRRIFALRRLKQISSIVKQDLIQVYNAYIRSILEYNSPLFAGMSVCTQCSEVGFNSETMSSNHMLIRL